MKHSSLRSRPSAIPLLLLHESVHVRVFVPDVWSWSPTALYICIHRMNPASKLPVGIAERWSGCGDSAENIVGEPTCSCKVVLCHCDVRHSVRLSWCRDLRSWSWYDVAICMMQTFQSFHGIDKEPSRPSSKVGCWVLSVVAQGSRAYIRALPTDPEAR